MSHIYNVYCDESCHLQNDNQKALVLGAVWIKKECSGSTFRDLKALKEKHGLSRHFEAKWTKVSQAKKDYYTDLINYFFDNQDLHFRGVVVPDKTVLNHDAFNQNHDTWYYKMFFLLLKFILQTDSHYNLYLDIKDTKSLPKVNELKRILNITSASDISILNAQQIRSHEVELMQVTDMLIGALSYKHRGLTTNETKLELIDLIENNIGEKIMTASTSREQSKFNILIWNPNHART